MGRIVYDLSVSLDGRVESPEGSLDWVAVDAETHALFNDAARAMSAFLLGRRTYDLLQAFWPSADAEPGVEPVIADFADIWRRKPKHVFTRTADVADPTVTVEREVTRERIEQIRHQHGGDLSVGGADVAASFMRLGLVDRLVMYVNPAILGGGRRYLAPGIGFSVKLGDATTLPSGIARLVYDVTAG